MRYPFNMIFDGFAITIIDGDTYDLRVDVSHMHPEQPIWTPRIRCAHFDSPERKEPGWAEAKAGLQWKLANKPLRIETYGRDAFKRLLAETFVDGEKLSDWAVTSGYARRVNVALQLSR